MVKRVEAQRPTGDMHGDGRHARDALGPPWHLLAALAVLLAYNAPLLQKITLGHDGVLQYYPAEHALAEALARGTLPFWTPHVQAGFPLFAQGQPGELYPIDLLAFGLLPTPLAHNLTLVVHQLLAFLFTTWWGGVLGLSSAAAVWMGVLFSFVPPFEGGDVLLVNTVTWMPLLLGIAERCVQRGIGPYLWLLIPVTAAQWLGGFPQLALYTALATHIYLGVRVCTEDWPWSTRAARIAAWSGATLLGILLAAPQLLPTYELSRFSIRAGGIPADLASEKSLFPAALLTLLLPSWRAFFWFAGLGMALYIGILPCLLALATVLARPRRPWLSALLVVTGVTLILAFGTYSPLFPLMRRLPGFAYFRIPSRYLYITQLGLITLFGLGWDLFVAGTSGRWARVLRRCLQLAVALIVFNGIVVRPLLAWARPHLLQLAERYTVRYVMSNPFHIQPLSYYQAKIAALYAQAIEAVSLARPEGAIPLGVAVVAAVTWWWGFSDDRRRRRLAVLWGGLILLDIWASTGWQRETSSRALVGDAVPIVQRLTREIGSHPCRLYGVTDASMIGFSDRNLALMQPNYNLIFDLQSVGIYAPLTFDAYNRLMDRLGTVDLGVGFREVSLEDVTRDRGLLDFLNVCYVLSRRPLTEFTPMAQVGDVSVYRNDRAFPRAFAVGRIEVADSSETALTWVKSHQDRLRDTASVDAPAPLQLNPDAAARAQVSIAEYHDTAVAVDVTAADTVLLVLTDTDYPGWQASVDGQPTRLYRTDALFRGVVVPHGTHRVEFRYRSAMFRYGVLIALAAGVGALAWIVIDRTSRSESLRHFKSD